MKLKLLILVTFISMIFINSIKDIKSAKEKREKLHLKDDSVDKKSRSGSMKDGFILPGFYIVNLNDLKAVKAESFVSPNTKFNAKQVEEPSTEYEKVGIVFSFEKFDESLSGIMLRILNTNQYYLPYRYIKSNPIYKDSWLFWKNKSIELILTNDNNESFSFNIVFPFKLFGNYIEDSDAIKLASKIGQRKEEIIKSLKDSLIELRKRTNTIVQNTGLIESLNNEIITVENKKKDLAEQFNKLTSNSIFIESEISKNIKLLEQVKLQLLTLEQSVESLKSQLTSNDLEIKSNKELRESLSTNNKEEIISKKKEEVNIESSSLKSLIETLQISLPEKAFLLRNMNMNIKKVALSKIVEDFLLKITPRIDVTKANAKAK